MVNEGSQMAGGCTVLVIASGFLSNNHVDIKDVGLVSKKVRRIVEKDWPADSPGARAYDAHVRKNMARARKDPRIGRMIRG